MADSNLARPYARAAFALAGETGDRAGWSERLALLAAVAEDERVAAALRAPRITRADRAALVVRICDEHLDDGARNLVRLLAENGRLALLPEVARQYEALRADAEGRIDAYVRSATALDAEQEQRIATSLKKRLDREVTLHCEVDESLLGGAVIRAGDLVIDGSLKGRLARLASRLAHQG